MLPNLAVDNRSSAFLQFDSSAIPAGINSAGIAQANLLLYVNRVATADKIDAVSVTRPWSEWEPGALTFNTRPAVGTPFATPGQIASGNPWVVLDVTDQVRAWINSPLSAHGIVIQANTSNRLSCFWTAKRR